MAGKVEKKRAELRRKLIDLGETRIATGGIEQIKARDLASEAGCAVGAIYNVFGDLNDLVMAVNGRTFKRLGSHVVEAVNASPDAAPVETLIIMGHAYLDFAMTNTHAWRTLFDLEMSTDQEVPDGPDRQTLDAQLSRYGGGGCDADDTGVVFFNPRRENDFSYSQQLSAEFSKFVNFVQINS